jgi:hypothetical protein
MKALRQAMPVEFKVLRLEDKDRILALEKAVAAAAPDFNPLEAEMASWHARWRPEALDHYLPLGWSFGAFDPDRNELKGYLLAQPLLFFRGLTQSLWVEWLRASDPAVAASLAEVAYKWARDKHLQQVLYSGADETSGQATLQILIDAGLENRSQWLDDKILKVNSSRMKV